MNVLLHTTTGIGIVVLLTNIKKIERSKYPIVTCVCVCIAGILSHGILDTIPHCYPIPSKLDVLLGLFMILIASWFSNKKYRLIVLSSFIGCIIPDLIDLSPAIINKQLGWNLPILDKIFPWHYKEYSGSIYSGNCNISTINHILLLTIISGICWYKPVTMKTIFNNR
ncbi:hypothetical protein [Sediminibacterium sp. KACHI17]|jgi:hypothetical protein|uniref:hypothetical protein n=1 Tax=Sediminibacterium sp. KACHI17 TaxID=1751071 RepID=UPI00336582F5